LGRGAVGWRRPLSLHDKKIPRSYLWYWHYSSEGEGYKLNFSSSEVLCRLLTTKKERPNAASEAITHRSKNNPTGAAEDVKLLKRIACKR